jgi:hypothetical protein
MSLSDWLHALVHAIAAEIPNPAPAHGPVVVSFCLV